MRRLNEEDYESTPPTETDISSLIKEQTVEIEQSDEQKEFNSLSKNHKFDRLNNLIKKSQIYSQIIADNILQRSLDPKPNSTDKNAEEKPGQFRKKRKTKRQQDITSMLSKNISDSTRATRSAIESSQTESSIKQPDLVSGGIMKDYQLEGLQWLTTLFENGLNGVLADEMGLGKTLQCISFLSFLIEKGIKGPFLIVAPLSTISNWFNEVKKFAPAINIVKYSGNKELRSSISIKSLVNRENASIIVTSYELSIRDFKKLNSISWSYLIVDEGHRLKNNDCTLIRFLKRLNVSNRLLITGTPLQNNLDELWSLLNFILPDIFHDLDLFQQWFNFDELTKFEKEEDVDNSDEDTKRFIKLNIQENLIKNLHTILKPFILRRLKKDVIKDLPPKKEYLIHIPLMPLQQKLYSEALENNLGPTLLKIAVKEFINHNFKTEFKTQQDFDLVDKLLSGAMIQKNSIDPKNYKEPNSDDEFDVSTEEFSGPVEEGSISSLKTKLLQPKLSKLTKQKLILEFIYPKISKEINNLSLQNTVMQLRNICNSPYIYYEPFDITDNNELKEKKFMEILYKNSSKIQVLDQLCNSLVSNGHKVLIFSQFTKLLDLLHDWFHFNDYKLSRFDGSYSQTERDQEIKRFNEDPNTSIFLLSTRAGGLGINLTAADTVILFDNDWNPQMDLQAIDRVHRIGQTKPVKIFRFLVKNSIEELLISKSTSKRFLEKLVIQMGEFKFQKFKNILDQTKNSKQSMFDMKNMIDFTKTNFNQNELKSSTAGFEYEFNEGPKKAFQLEANELAELLDRSDRSYLQNDISKFSSISTFETLNNLDK